MSPRRNYSKMSEKKDNKKVEEVELTTTENEEIVINNVSDEPLTEATAGLAQVVENKSTIGFVDGCESLYVRKDSFKESAHLAIIKKLSEVVIDLENSTEDFYKVKTSEGIEGYCMKKFITIK